MLTPPASVGDVTSPEANLQISKEECRWRWFEVFLVLALSTGMALFNSFYFLNNAPATPLRLTTLRSLYGIVQESLSLLLLGYVLSRRKLRLRDIGLQWSRRDILPSFVVTTLSGLAYFAGALCLQLLYHRFFGVYAHGPSARQYFASPTLVALPLILLNPFFEELIVRAYLMTEIKALTGSTTMAVAVSVVLQASYHLYYGWFGALTVAFSFLVFAVYYARSGRAVPVIVAHAAFDIYGLVRMM